MCTSCLKHKPPVIDVEQGSSEAPITLDDSDSEEEKNVERPMVSETYFSKYSGYSLENLNNENYDYISRSYSIHLMHIQSLYKQHYLYKTSVISV